MSRKHSNKKEPARRAVKLATAAAVSDWGKIAQCESGGDWSTNHSHGSCRS